MKKVIPLMPIFCFLAGWIIGQSFSPKDLKVETKAGLSYLQSKL